jgi:hypothetical protein
LEGRATDVRTATRATFGRPVERTRRLRVEREPEEMDPGEDSQ